MKNGDITVDGQNPADGRFIPPYVCGFFDANGALWILFVHRAQIPDDHFGRTVAGLNERAKLEARLGVHHFAHPGVHHFEHRF